jgi:AraC family transcriptional regulator
MVCPRCIMSVEQILKTHKLEFSSIRLGEVELIKNATVKQLEKLNNDLKAVGFEILDNQRQQQIEQIKNLLIEKAQSGNLEGHFSITKYLTSKVHKDYSHLSKLFTEVEGITIEHFFILQKIEKAKEWLVYNEYSNGDIAISLGYSSVQHLSSQFKKVTGMTPSQFKSIGSLQRKSINNL